ncbi:MAG: Lrp/AsnC family transcriptional regulator [Candidatus Thorarchaeota archaeon]|nr:Lrp/AsnC family transcriptional regulator [Candidatus Thorarchaeota archaeon]
MVLWSSYGLDRKDYLIFLCLEQDPSLSNASISEEVSETESISAESVRTRIQKMKESGFLRPDRTIEDPVLGERTQTEVEAVYNPHQIGLLRQHVLFQGVPNNRSLDGLKAACDSHPYTHYRTLGYSKGATLYAQFDIPPSAIETMHCFYTELEERQLFANLHVYETQSLAKHEADFHEWNLVDNKWSMEYGTKSRKGTGLSRIENLWDDFLQSHDEKGLEQKSPEMAFTLDELDMALLRELTINGTPSIKPLGPIHNRDPSTISRRISRLKETVAADDMLYYDRSVFDLTYPQLVVGRFLQDNEMNADSLYWFIESGGLPFESKGIIDDDEFILFITTPPSVAPEISEFMWEHSAEIDVFQLQLDSSFTYYFYHKNYLGNGKWNTNRDYLLDEPL